MNPDENEYQVVHLQVKSGKPGSSLSETSTKGNGSGILPAGSSHV
jgi:hypothetical protein